MNEKEFEKQQLEQLLNDLKDIDKYTSFKNGAFIYDLGKYQGSLLVNHINNLQSKIDKAIEFVESMEYCGQEDYFYDKKSKDPCGNDNTFNDSKYKLLDILKEE